MSNLVQIKQFCDRQIARADEQYANRERWAIDKGIQPESYDWIRSILADTAQGVVSICESDVEQSSNETLSSVQLSTRLCSAIVQHFSSFRDMYLTGNKEKSFEIISNEVQNFLEH